MSDSEHHEIHMPPNSWVPINIALSLMVAMVGLLMAPIVWIAGAVWLFGSLAWWLKSARSEYEELPESGGH